MSNPIYHTSNGPLTLCPPAMRGMSAEIGAMPTPLATPDPEGYTHALAWTCVAEGWAGSTLLRPDDAAEIAGALALGPLAP